MSKNRAGFIQMLKSNQGTLKLGYLTVWVFRDYGKAANTPWKRDQGICIKYLQPTRQSSKTSKRAHTSH